MRWDIVATRIKGGRDEGRAKGGEEGNCKKYREILGAAVESTATLLMIPARQITGCFSLRNNV